MAVAGIIIGLLSYTAALMLMHQHGGPGDAANPVTVITEDCEQYGPISRAGLGYWWECTAGEVDGSKTVHTSSSELTPDDIGKLVDVYAKSKGAGHPEHYYRDVEHPLHGVGIAVGTVGLLVVIGLLGNAFMRLIPQSLRLETDKKHAERLREKYRQDGRL